MSDLEKNLPEEGRIVPTTETEAQKETVKTKAQEVDFSLPDLDFEEGTPRSRHWSKNTVRHSIPYVGARTLSGSIGRINLIW